MCVAVLDSEVVEAPGASVSSSLKPTLVDLEGGCYTSSTLPVFLANRVVGRRSVGRGAPKSGGSGSNSSGDGGNKKPLPKVDATGEPAQVQVHYDAHLLSLYLRDGENLRYILAGAVLTTLHGHILFKNWHLCGV